MKKVFLFLLIGLFIGLFVFAVGNTTFAQQHKTAVTGVNLTGSCLTGMGKGCLNYDNLVWGSGSHIDSVNERRTVTTIAQDVILAATYMVGTVLTIIIIYCGLMYIFAARDGKDVSNYKKGLINAAIGAVLVRGAYAIVRLIQYIAKG